MQGAGVSVIDRRLAELVCCVGSLSTGLEFYFFVPMQRQGAVVCLIAGA